MKTKKKTKSTKPILISVLFLLLLVYFGMSFYYSKHFYYGSLINGIDYSGKTVKQIEDSISKKISDYSITLFGRNDVSDVITAKDFNYHYISDGQIQELKKEQNPFAWPFSFFNKKELSMEATTEFDEEMLTDAFSNLVFFKEENMVAPTDATIEYKNDSFQVIKETQGSYVKKKTLKKALWNAIDTNQSTLSLESFNCYKKPEITQNSKALKKALKKLNKYTNLTITYDFGSRSEVLNKEQLHSWVTYDKDFNVSIDPNKVTEYVNYLNYHYTTFGIPRQFTKHNGKEITIRGGDYGWWINRSKEAEELTQVIKAGKSVTRTPVYYQTAASRELDDIGNSYVEIDLSKQHLWVFKNGKKMIDSKIVTGNVARNFGTPKGAYSITYKERDATLVGENYSSPVSYWMPFNGNIGMHDAGWRNKFGGDIYKTRGSHGCVNLPPQKAAKIFDIIEKGTPVIVY
ncbi:L,D-transpeptidase family protein [Velocimicrobium porci]|uniref:L,D-transpeptidase family protein n=1 Tax=Velocimicrobium porci TaxID=2606634 RepID=A0A6L5XXN6_9FIRM|nr:L,D-transpeptidase family protein [Velocimicrobium porci]MSS63058.1 L,D-transpeptidase family protein [Velocimicrobium porci]